MATAKTGSAIKDPSAGTPGGGSSSIIPGAEEHAALKQAERLVAALQDLPEHERQRSLLLSGPNGQQVPVTASLYQALLRALYYLAQDAAVSVAPASRQLTTTQAAAILGVSRPFLTKLLDTGQLPGTRVGTKRRIALEDLLRYKRVHEVERRAALDRLIEMSGETDIDFEDIAELYRHRRSRNQHQAPDDERS